MKLSIWQPGLLTAATLALTACGGGGGESLSTANSASMSTAQSVKNRTAGQIEPSEGAARSNGVATFIVRMADEPATAYKGGIKGLNATKPSAGQKLDPDAPAVVGYVGYLASRHDAALKGVGGAKKLYSYGYVFNGFAADLTEAQAHKLAQTPGVLSVSRNEKRILDTSTTPAMLGLTGSSGFWATRGTGEGVVIGVIDSGIWPEHPSFSDRTGSNGSGTQTDKLSYQQISGWHGKCQNGTQFNNSHCNQKLIGARYFNASWGGDAGIAAELPWEFNSPRDFDGHGTHTASTAGGNEGVQATGIASTLGKVSGIAPRARIAAYKALWRQADGTGSGFNADLVAAIDRAVADGVDVINYSVSGSRTSFRDPVEIAFLYAADAGVFVATSAGNSGPSVSTVAHPSPWVTTVAAGTHTRAIVGGSVTLGNGVTYTGVGYLLSAGPAPLVDASVAGLPGADAATLALCYGSADGAARLDPAKVAGKIVVCNRGGNFLVNKATAVKEAGGIGMVLVNTPGGASTTPFVAYDIAAVHLAASAYVPIKAYAAAAGATATINRADVTTDAAAPYTADFSSRGPLQASGSLLKPDLIAPGQDVLAGVSPAGYNGKLFDLISGTSMSSPHVAGLAALMKQQHPTWSPMAIKSALMTTGTDVLDGPNTSATVIFRQGAGHVRPLKAADPGLVFDSSFADWLGFLCGTQLPAANCTAAGVPVVEPSNFNGASIALGKLTGSQKVTRTVTNVGSEAETYTFSVAGMSGIDVALPGALTVQRGKSASFALTFTATSAAALNVYTGGQLTLTGSKGHVVRLPMVVNTVALAAPVEVAGAYNVTFGYTGAFTATPRGLLPATTQPGSIQTDATKDFTFVVPAGQTYLRFSLFDANVSQAADLDLEVYRDGTFVGSSGGVTSAEAVSFANPVAGTYTVRVVGYLVPVGAADFTLFSWSLGSTSEGNMTVTAPASATLGQTGNIGLAFTGLVTGTKYLGSVAYGGAAGMPNATIVRVDGP